MTHPRAAAAGLRRQPDPDRHPRLPRRPRRRARGHLRRPLAGADRGARHDGGLPRRLRPALDGGLPLLARLHLPRRGDLRLLARAPQDAHPAGGVHRHRLRGLGGARHPGDVEGDAGDRAPQGDAGRQHPVGDLAGAGEDGGALRRSSAPSTTSSASASCSSRWTRRRPSGGAGTSAAGTSSSTSPSASSSPPRWRSPACCWSSASSSCRRSTAMLFAERLGPRLAIGWTMGALVSARRRRRCRSCSTCRPAPRSSPPSAPRCWCWPACAGRSGARRGRGAYFLV